MITHIVFFRLRDRSPEKIDKAAGVLRGLEGKVEVIRSLEVGVDLLKKERSYDIALTARFDSLDDLEVYQKHPFHVEVANYIKGESESVASVDYES